MKICALKPPEADNVKNTENTENKIKLRSYSLKGSEPCSVGLLFK